MQLTATIADVYEEVFERRAERERAMRLRSRRRCATCTAGSCVGRRRFCVRCIALSVAIVFTPGKERK